MKTLGRKVAIGLLTIGIIICAAHLALAAPPPPGWRPRPRPPIVVVQPVLPAPTPVLAQPVLPPTAVVPLVVRPPRPFVVVRRPRPW